MHVLSISLLVVLISSSPLEKFSNMFDMQNDELKNLVKNRECIENKKEEKSKNVRISSCGHDLVKAKFKSNINRISR